MSASTSPDPIQYRGTTTNGSFYFCIEGLPKRYTWQDLKDLIRKEAAHGIWTEMAFFPNGQTGETGWARLQRQDEAFKLFRYLASNLVESRRLRVHLFDTSLSPPQLMGHTCGNSPCIAVARSAEASRLATAPHNVQSTTPYTPYARPPATYAVQPVSPYTTPILPVMPAAPPSFAPPAYSMQALEAKMASMGMNTADPAVMAAGRARLAQAYAQQAAAQTPPIQNMQSQAQVPVYVPSSSGTYVNVGQGAIKTEVRGIFVSNIDYKANSKDILRYFGRAGEIVRCQLQKDPVSGKSKGNATVQYAAANDAKKAVGMFNNEKYMSMRLKVRLDKEPVAVGTSSASSPRANGKTSNTRSSQPSRNITEPIIANGSTCR